MIVDDETLDLSNSIERLLADLNEIPKEGEVKLQDEVWAVDLPDDGLELTGDPLEVRCLLGEDSGIGIHLCHRCLPFLFSCVLTTGNGESFRPLGSPRELGHERAALSVIPEHASRVAARDVQIAPSIAIEIAGRDRRGHRALVRRGRRRS